MGSDWATGGGRRYELTLELIESTGGHIGWSFEMVETCLMKVGVDRGSHGVSWGHRGWLKIRVDSAADKVHRGSHWVEFRTEI